MKKWKNIKENKGSSIVLVLITMALVGVMIAIILMAVLLNYKMKAVDSMSKDTFYTAETAMDEIKAGLENEVSTAYIDSYIDVMQHYTSYTETERKSLFEKNYVYALRDALEDPTRLGSSTTYYDISTATGLGSYISADKIYNDTTKRGVKVETTSVEKDPVLAFTTDGVVLKNLMVTYYADKNFESRVRTDILLAYPKIDFTQTTNAPNLLEYALVANTSLNTTAGVSSIQGSVYGGKNGITLPNASTLDITGASTIMTKDDITLDASSTLTTDSQSGLWAKNINVTSSTLNLSGTTHVANDLIIEDQDDASSSINLNGEYYGFGNPNTAKLSNYIMDQNLTTDIDRHEANYSSAILINGTSVGMNLSNLSRLMLAGNSYVGVTLKNTTLDEADQSQNTSDVRMGESLTVKSNQLAYLVPSEYVGAGSAYGGSNPMTAAQYRNLSTDVNNNANIKFVNTDASNEATGANGYTTAFYPFQGSSIVYFYLKFDNADAAAAYFRDYYNVNSDRLDRYLKFYSDGINLSNNSSAIFNLYGNAMVYENDDVSVKADSADSAETDEVLQTRQTGMQNTFGALGTKLITDYLELSNDEKDADDVFVNLVKSAEMVQAIEDHGVATQGMYTFETNNTNLYGIMSSATNIVLRAGDNAASLNNAANIVGGDGAYTIYVGDETKVNSKKLRVLITTGNVTIESGCNFQGLIIANGQVILNGNASITSSAADVAKVLQADDDGRKIMDYLIDSDQYVYGGAASGEVVGSSDEETTLGDLIVYRHWKKE